ncbi:MAG: polysaccharide deacetylase [Actinobacteria bacterium HGW-Actinobacteria-1]|jgi:peptidoglycan/xylan/chitin deacetylase (PgdA/CDA1 family)|nr:MAG: polysaccharide deacetylase [Actinobacteria bacterium HGW-Actinobacteria-1]
MADYALSLSLIALAAGLLGLGWNRIAGRPESRFRAVGRVLLVVVVSILLVGVATYHLSKSRSFQFAGELVQRVETNEKVVALTFDDGPTPGYTEEVLQTLAEHGARATFYLTGRECEENPELLDVVVASGNELGNHTYSHRRLYFVPEKTVAAEVEQTDAIFRAAGYEAPTTFRMPGCKRLLTTPLYLDRTGRTTVVWDLEPDSIAGIADNADAIVEYVGDGVRPGSIVLMHVMYEGRQPTRDALPRILDRLSAQGYRFVTVSELLAMQ